MATDLQVRIYQIVHFTVQSSHYSCFAAGFAELAKLKSLRVLDLGDCGISLSTSEFSTFLLVHLKKLPKLEYLNFSGNPIQDTIPHFRYLVIHELPHLKYLNWDMISKEVRIHFRKLYLCLTKLNACTTGPPPRPRTC